MTLESFIKLGRRVFYDPANIRIGTRGLTPLVVASLVATSGGMNEDSDFPDAAFDGIVGYLAGWLMRGGYQSCTFTEQQAHMLIFARYLYATGKLTDDDYPTEEE